jgi:hypothetical protein
MFDPQHPVVRALQRAGYRVTAHAYFRGDAVSLCATAHHTKSKRMFHGRSRKADVEEAITALGHASGVKWSRAVAAE